MNVPSQNYVLRYTEQLLPSIGSGVAQVMQPGHTLCRGFCEMHTIRTPHSKPSDALTTLASFGFWPKRACFISSNLWVCSLLELPNNLVLKIPRHYLVHSLAQFTVLVRHHGEPAVHRLKGEYLPRPASFFKDSGS